MNQTSNRNPAESVNIHTTDMIDLIDEVLQLYLCYKIDVNCTLTQRTIFPMYSNYNFIF